jgi:2-phospho-L-lactate guanylyltransferase
MLDDVSSALIGSAAVHSVLVVSPDDRVIEHASSLGLDTILETRPPGLNAALNLATRTLMTKAPYSPNLIVPVDIPLLQISSLAGLSDLVKDVDESIVVATKSRNGGTNLLLRWPADVIELSFGENSFNLHKQNALSKSVEFREWVSQDAVLDIDTPEDLLEFMRRGRNTKTWQFLDSLEFLSY